MILETRLRKPPLRDTRVQRNRLLRKLDHITKSKLTMLIAPAGFGKTTLICEWAYHTNDDVAWITLDGLDLTQSEFMQYLIAAVQTIHPEVGTSADRLLKSANPSESKQTLTTLINDLLTIQSTLILVLDDYHAVAENDDIQQSLFFLIQNAPQPIHFVITSRTLPTFNLARLRSHHQLLDITPADLRFTATEARDFLIHVSQVSLTDAQLLQLEHKTAGWVTGLQLAGQSLLQTDDIDTYIKAFSGQTQPIRQYLLEEVFQQQADPIRNFLITTSFLDELCADLCNAVLEITNSQDILNTLAQSQLFIAPQDYEHQWFRYYGIFKEFLQPFFDALTSDKQQTLYENASRWYEAQDNLHTAIRYAIASDNGVLVAALLTKWLATVDWVHNDMYRLEAWFQALPLSIIEQHIDLHLNYLWLKLEVYADAWDDILNDLTHIKALLETNKGGYSPHELILFSAQVDMLMVNHARAEQNHEQVIQLCESIIRRLPEDEFYMLGGTIAHQAAAYQALGDYPQARQAYTNAIAICEKAQNADGLLFASWQLMELLLEMNLLPQAKSVFDHIEGYQDSRTGPDMGAIQIALGEVYRRTQYLTKARTTLEQGIKLCEPFPAWHESTQLGQQRLDQLDQQSRSVDTLTEREMETLEFLQSDLSVQEIADNLSVSVSTIRTYCKRIYNKLHVHSRAEAVFRARELDILS